MIRAKVLLAGLCLTYAGVLFGRGGWQDPPGGWDYIYEADPGQDTHTFRAGAVTEGLLDGSWLGGTETYFWDGSAPGEYDTGDPQGAAPGGAEIVAYEGLGEDGGQATVLSIEVAGDTTEEAGNPFNFAWDSPANQSIYFYRGTYPKPDSTSTASVNKGMTLIARWRLKPDPSDVETGEGKNWRGQGFVDDGKGMISVVDQDQVNASLSITDEGKLILMERYEIPLPDSPTAFLSTWLAVARIGPEVFRVELYLNGSSTPAFAQDVQDPPSGDEEGTTPDDYIAFGLPVTGSPGAMELDYIGYKAGFLRPGDKILPPQALSCSLDRSVDPPQLTMTWEIPEGVTYESIEILREGQVIATLEGTALTYSTNDVGRAAWSYAVRGVAGGEESFAPVCVVNNCPGITSHAAIEYDRVPPAAHVTWELPPEPLQAIEIARDGQPLASLDPTATEFWDETLTPDDGEVRYEITFIPQQGNPCPPTTPRRVIMTGPDRPYLDPPGGWDYVYNPDAHDPETNPMDRYVPEKGVEGALDGTWIRSNQTDHWDGSAPGDTTPPGAAEVRAPGGVEILERPSQGLEGQTIKTLSIEDAGDPRDVGYRDPSNRKIYFAHLLDPPGEEYKAGRLSAGITLYVRFRLTPDPKDVADPPNGEPTRSSNRGQIMVCYYDGDPQSPEGEERSRSWAMSLNGDVLDLSDGGDIAGLKPGDWVSVWVTLEDADDSGYFHNHLFLNGATVPVRPDWRTQLDRWEEKVLADQTIPFTAICMGLLSTDEDGAIEIDFIKVKYGEYFPESPIAPEGPRNLSCTAQGDSVVLTWANEIDYDEIEVREGDAVRLTLPGDATEALLENQSEGTHSYTVVGRRGMFYSVKSSCMVVIGGAELEVFYRGEANQDGKVNIADAVALLGYLFGGAPEPECPDAVDCNDDGKVNVADAIALLGYLFGGVGALPEPAGGICGPDPTNDTLGTCVFDPALCGK